MQEIKAHPLGNQNVYALRQVHVLHPSVNNANTRLQSVICNNSLGKCSHFAVTFHRIHLACAGSCSKQGEEPASTPHVQHHGIGHNTACSLKLSLVPSASRPVLQHQLVYCQIAVALHVFVVLLWSTHL